MSAITDLRRIFDVKNLIFLFIINLFDDIISISSFLSLKEETVTENGLHFLFDRYLSNDISILNFAVYISLYALAAYCVINRIREDNQKFGIFYLVRYSRKQYVLGKAAGTVIFSFFISFLSVFQSFVAHRIMKITISPEQYVTVLALSFLLMLSGAAFGMLIYSVLKNANLSFLGSMLIYTAMSVILTARKNTVPTPNNIEIEYIYPLIIAIVSLAASLIIMLKNDFITTKIKE